MSSSTTTTGVGAKRPAGRRGAAPPPTAKDDAAASSPAGMGSEDVPVYDLEGDDGGDYDEDDGADDLGAEEIYDDDEDSADDDDAATLPHSGLVSFRAIHQEGDAKLEALAHTQPSGGTEKRKGKQMRLDPAAAPSTRATTTTSRASSSQAGDDDDDDDDGNGDDRSRGRSGGGGGGGGGGLAEKDYSALELKADHETRPLWVCPDGHIFLESFSPLYRHAYDFLIAVAEPVCRPLHMHEYQLSLYSLYAAVSVGLQTNDIISVLNKLSKTRVPVEVEQFIRDSTQSYGKVKLVLQRNRYFVESPLAVVLELLLQDDIIRGARIDDAAARPGGSGGGGGGASGGFLVSRAPDAIQIPGINRGDGDGAAGDSRPLLQEDDEMDDGFLEFNSFEIDPTKVEYVKKRCIELEYPMLEEYDFRNDSVNANLAIDLKASTTIRTYQEKSLSKMFGNGRARSGIIVLPCGAGKTLVGITAASTVKKSCLVLSTSAVSAEQWRHQFKLWSTVDDKDIRRFTSRSREMFSGPAGVLVTTYTMLAFSGRRSAASAQIMEQIQSREWGLVLLDEVHVVPAQMFRKVISVVRAHCKLGLTATLVREDSRISDLNFLIGPKLYEANWMDLMRSGFIASVQCAEVWCPMTPMFYEEYHKAPPAKQKLLYVMNPTKLQACQFLVRYHEQRGDKIIVFSDEIFALIEYAKLLGKPYIYGPTTETEKLRILGNFQMSSNLNTIFISRVGDNSIDLPGATVIIQVSSHYGSRRQEAQRLGRILRPKGRSEGGFNAFFYSLVSQDTSEMFYSTKRQQFLIDQGYSFKVITQLQSMFEGQDLLCSTIDAQSELLGKTMTSGVAGRESLDDDDENIEERRARSRAPAAARRRTFASGMSGISGGDGLSYSESRPFGGARSIYAQPPARNPLLAKILKGR